MNDTLLVLALLLCVAASAVVVRVVRLPLPLTQIALGAAISLPEFGLHVDLDPHLFLLIFVPPLLFADGFRMPKREFFRMRERILALALGLVLFTVAGIGCLLHWVIPALPLAAAFALAAVLSPTDAVAVSAMTGNAAMPKQLLHTLQGEALMNDASGLTAFNFAIAAAATGTFSLRSASLSFAVLTVGGIGLGAALGWAVAMLQKWLSSWDGIEAQGEIVMLLLLPFAAYLLAEDLNTSGILAAVAAGMTLNLLGVTNAGMHADTRIAAGHVWSMLEYLFNGVIFVLMGLQLPHIIGAPLRSAHQTAGLSSVLPLVGYALVLAAALTLLRLVWVWMMVRLTQLVRHVRGTAAHETPSRRLQLAAAVGGVRGGITLAAVLSVPLTLQGGSPFPGRDLMIFLAASVTLISLVAAAITLPRLLRGLVLEQDPEALEEQLARMRACEAAIAAIAAAARTEAARGAGRGGPRAGAQPSPAALAAARLIEFYQHRLRSLANEAAAPHSGAGLGTTLRLLLSVGLAAERAAVLGMHRGDEINDTVLNKLLYELDVRETSHGFG